MESGRIEKLLDRYFEATSSVAEEEILRDYFTSDEVAPHLEKYTPLFSYLSQSKEERFTKPVPFRTRMYYFRWVSVAAAVVLALGIYFGNDSYQNYQEQKEAEYAYNETRKALSLLAANLERGTEKVAYLNQFEEAKEKIYKND